MTELEKLPIRLRNYDEKQDTNFILNSWLKSYRDSPQVNRMENSAYYHEQAKIIKELLKTVNVLVACDKSDSNQIFGYLVSQRVDNTFCLHYVYVKLPFRNMGIAKMMIAARDHELGKEVGLYTHHTDPANKLAYKYRMMFNPYVTTYFHKYVTEPIDYAAIDD